MKKLLNKKNNKGFSLVELIVVVLIMGIIAVALAPQVMKWVGTARENSDDNSKKDIKSAITIAVADAQNEGYSVPSSDTVFYFKTGGTSSLDTKLKTAIESVTGGDYSAVPSGGGFFKVTIKGGSGVVDVQIDNSAT